MHGHSKSPINVPYKSPKRPCILSQKALWISPKTAIYGYNWFAISSAFSRRLHSSSAAFARNLEKLVDETMMEAENAPSHVDF